MPRCWANSDRSTSAPKRLSQMIFICRERRRRVSATCAWRSMRRSSIGQIDLPGACRRSAYRPNATGRSSSMPRRRLSANFDRFNLATDLSYRRQYLRVGPGAARRIQRRADRHRPHRRRPAARTGRLRRFAVGALPDRRAVGLLVGVARTSIGKATLAYDGARATAPAPGSAISAASNSLALALTGEAATDGSVAFGFNLNFSLDPRHGFTLSRQPLAAGGIGPRHSSIRDLNDNGVRDPAEPLEKGALVTTGTRQVADQPTDASGAVTVGGLTPYQPITVGIDSDQPRRPDACPEEGAAGRGSPPGRSGGGRRSAWSAAAISKARWSRAASSGSKASTSSWSTPAARSSRPRGPISTASSCSNASPTAPTPFGSAQGIGGSGEDRRRSRRYSSRSPPTSRSSGSARFTRRPCRVACRSWRGPSDAVDRGPARALAIRLD